MWDRSTIQSVPRRILRKGYRSELDHEFEWIFFAVVAFVVLKKNRQKVV